MPSARQTRSRGRIDAAGEVLQPVGAQQVRDGIVDEVGISEAEEAVEEGALLGLDEQMELAPVTGHQGRKVEVGEDAEALEEQEAAAGGRRTAEDPRAAVASHERSPQARPVAREVLERVDAAAAA